MSTWLDLRDNPRLKKIYEDRVEIIKSIRDFFWSQGFLETDVPQAVHYPGQEPYLNPIPLTFHDPYGQGQQFYLHTSPEYALKKLLAAGFKKIFSITKCFRDYESFGGNHNTEFTMIEWYRAPGTYRDFMDDMEALFKYVGEKVRCDTLRYKDKAIKVNQPWLRKSMKEVWREYLDADLDTLLEFDALAKFAKAKEYSVDAADEYEDVFFKLFLNEIEQKLGFDAPTFIYDYPKQMCSLSRTSAIDPRYAERVECYVAGLELCNGFGELTNANEQRARLEADQELRRKLGKPTWPIDEDFIAALQSGMPDAGGVALGVDRMVVLFTGAKDINEVIFQSVADQLNT